ncbi:MAG: hypothetical protein LBH07_00510, partial [Treponema sp.]|nr:hypothetical protein [Treponema sp.]
SWGEVGVEFGKSAVTGALNTAGGVLFSGFGHTLDGASKFAGLTKNLTDLAGPGFSGVAAKTFMTGVQTLSTGTVTSAVSAVTYNNGEFGWSRDIFGAGMKNGLISTAISGTSTFTSGMMGFWNTGDNASKLTGFSNKNINDVGTFNNFLGGLAGQGINYALAGDFAMNVLNINNFSFFNVYNNPVQHGLLELHLGKNGVSMNMGSGGMDAGYTALTGFIRGLDVVGTNAGINAYAGKNLNVPVALRVQYGFGDSIQKKQLREILGGGIDLRAADGSADYAALSKMESGRKVVYLNGYNDNMDVSEQMRLGVILGHEAYRSGYGNSDFNELKIASIARIMMGDRVNNDYTWFYMNNEDFWFESYLISQAGTGEVFDDYLNAFYKNDEDYYWKWITADAHKQNGQEAYRNVILLNAMPKEQVDKINDSQLKEAVKKYREIFANINEYSGDKTLFSEKSDIEIYNYIKTNKKLQKELGVSLETFYSLYDYGCMLFSAMYGASTLTGNDLDPEWVNKFAKENGYYFKDPNSIFGSALGNGIMANLMTALTGGEFKVALADSFNKASLDKLLYFEKDKANMYIAHVRVQTSGTTIHSEMVAGINYDYNNTYTYNSSGRNVASSVPSGIKSIVTANPWKGDGSSLLSRTEIAPDNIVRWDVFKVSPTFQYYNRMFTGYRSALEGARF